MLSQCCGEPLDHFAIYKTYDFKQAIKLIGGGLECTKCGKEYPSKECQVREAEVGTEK